MPTYTFGCACGWQGDVRTGFDANNVACPVCDAQATKASVYRLNFGGFTRTPPGERDWTREFRAYREASEDLAYHEGVHSRIEGIPVQGPNLFGQAQARANDLIAKGAVDANDLS